MALASEGMALWDLDEDLGRARNAIIASGKASATVLQSGLGVSFTAAADLLERLTAAGVIGPADLSGRHPILQPGPQASVFDLVEDPNPAPEPGREEKPGAALSRFRETPEDVRVRDNTYRQAAARMLGFVRQLEGFAAERREIAARQKDCMTEAKHAGFSKAQLAAVVKARKQPAEVRDLDREEFDLYMAAIEAAEDAERGA